jgi:hypothetical protein
MKPVQVPATLTAFGAPPTKVIATVAYRDPGERAMRAIGETHRGRTSGQPPKRTDVLNAALQISAHW